MPLPNATVKSSKFRAINIIAKELRNFSAMLGNPTKHSRQKIRSLRRKLDTF